MKSAINCAFLHHIRKIYSPCIIQKYDVFHVQVGNDECSSGSSSRGGIAIECWLASNIIRNSVVNLVINLELYKMDTCFKLEQFPSQNSLLFRRLRYRTIHLGSE